MDIEQLTAKWQQTHDRVEEVHQLVDAMHRVELSKKSRWTAMRLKVGPVTELVIGGFIALLTGNFLADHWQQVMNFPLGAVPTLITALFGIFLIWQSVWQLIFIGKLDFANDVATTQAALVDLRRFRARSGQALLLTGITFWNVPPLAVLQWIGSYDVVQKLLGPGGVPAAWMVGNVIVGVAITGVLVLIARRLPPTSAFNRFASDVFAGGEVERAERQLVEIQDFRTVA